MKHWAMRTKERTKIINFTPASTTNMTITITTLIRGTEERLTTALENTRKCIRSRFTQCSREVIFSCWCIWCMGIYLMRFALIFWISLIGMTSSWSRIWLTILLGWWAGGRKFTTRRCGRKIFICCRWRSRGGLWSKRAPKVCRRGRRVSSQLKAYRSSCLRKTKRVRRQSTCD